MLAILAIVAFIVLPSLVDFLMEWFWFGAIGYRHVFVTSLRAQASLGAFTLLFAFLALYGTRVLDEKKRASWSAEDWQRFSAATSNIPFAAMATSRNQWRMKEIGWWRLGITALLFILLNFLHTLLGVPVVVDF